MKKLIIGITLIVIGLFSLLGFIKIRNNDQKKYNFFNNANYITTKEIDPSLNDKLIIVSGQVTPTSSTVDKEFNIETSSPLLIRYVEYYKKNNDSYSWQLQYETTEEYKYKKEEYYGSINIGMYTISSKDIKEIFEKKPYNSITKEQAKEYNFRLEEQKNGFTYLTEAYGINNESNAKEYENAKRIYYEYVDVAKLGVKTIIGVQKDNQIISTDEFTIKSFDGSLNKEEIIEQLYEPNSNGILFSLGSFILLEICGVLLLVTKNKEII